jgi:serine/threonine-protein phosphatase 4 regulatory subunit 1
MIGDVATHEGYEATREFILPLVDTLIQDEEFLVRQHTAEQLRGVARVCAQDGGESGYASLLDVVLPACARLLADSQPEVRMAAGETLVAVAGWAKKEDLGPHVLTIVLQLAHDEEQEELRMTAVSRGARLLTGRIVIEGVGAGSRDGRLQGRA